MSCPRRRNGPIGSVAGPTSPNKHGIPCANRAHSDARIGLAHRPRSGDTDRVTTVRLTNLIRTPIGRAHGGSAGSANRPLRDPSPFVRLPRARLWSLCPWNYDVAWAALPVIIVALS